MVEGNKVITFITACIPGTGYMYYGLMKKGFEAAMIFFMSIVLCISVYGGEIFLALIIPIWFYTFFDTFNIANKYNQGCRIKDDFNLFYGSSEFNKVLNRNINKRLVAYFLMTIGVVEILNKLSQGIFWEYPTLQLTLNTINKIFIPVILIILGISLLRSSKNHKDIVSETVNETEESSDTFDEFSKTDSYDILDKFHGKFVGEEKIIDHSDYIQRTHIMDHHEILEKSRND